jgi:hypothetical protein
VDLASISELTDAAVACGTLLPQEADASPGWLAYQPGPLSAMREPFVVKFHEAYAQALRAGLSATVGAGA